MKDLPRLETLSSAEKDALIRELWQRLQSLEQQGRQPAQKRVKKTSRNSSLPPSKGFKPNQSQRHTPSTSSAKRANHHEGGRELTQTPDQTVIAHATSCPHCGEAVTQSSQKLRNIYERIELPRVKAHITQVHHYGGVCPGCKQSYDAPVPVGLEPGSPFGESVASLVTYLRYSHAVSYQRLQQLMDELYGLSLSQGAIANLLQRVKTRLENPVQQIVERLRRSRVVGSDETSARVEGQTYWEWVFQNEQVCLHVIRPSRGKAVIEAVMDGHHPAVWLSDQFSAQAANPGDDWQVCLAHQLRDCQYAIDMGDEWLAPRMKRLFLKAIALHRRRHQLADSTVQQYRSRFNGALREILTLHPTTEAGQRLLNRYRKIQDHLLLFLMHEDVPPTNNASEQALRWSTVFRKVTNGFRSEWGADLFAAVRSLVNTARRQGVSAFDAICRAITSSQNDWLLG